MENTERRYEKKEGDFVLFESRNGGGGKPDVRGKLMLGGVEVEIVGWYRKTSNGGVMLTGKVDEKPKREGGEQQRMGFRGFGGGGGGEQREMPVERRREEPRRESRPERPVAQSEGLDEDVPF